MLLMVASFSESMAPKGNGKHEGSIGRDWESLDGRKSCRVAEFCLGEWISDKGRLGLTTFGGGLGLGWDEVGVGNPRRAVVKL